MGLKDLNNLVQVLFKYFRIALLVLVIFVVGHQLRPECLIMYDTGQGILYQYKAAHRTCKGLFFCCKEPVLLDWQAIYAVDYLAGHDLTHGFLFRPGLIAVSFLPPVNGLTDSVIYIIPRPPIDLVKQPPGIANYYIWLILLLWQGA